MNSKVKSVYKSIINDECDNLGREGLRTLVVTQKYLLSYEYEGWRSIYDKACTAMKNRNEEVRAAAELLEKDMDLLGKILNFIKCFHHFNH